MIVLARNRTLVQKAQVWGTWTTIEGAWATKQSDGFCNDLGSSEIFYKFGDIKRAGVAGPVVYDELGIAGNYVRICEKDPDGLIVAADGTRFSAVWAGVAGESELAPSDEKHYDQRVPVQGILSVLDMVVPARHYAVSISGTVSAEIGIDAAFNIIGNKKTGNRSAEKYDFGGGYSAYVFDMSGDGVEWTANDAAEYALAVAYLEAPGGPTFVLDGQLDALLFKDKFSITGMSCLEILTKTMNQKQGVGFRVAYDGTSTVIIDVMSLSKDLIIVPTGADVPANDRQFTLNLTPTGHSSKWSIKESQLAAYDQINVVIGRDKYIVTLSTDHFEPDWTADEKTAFDAIDEDSDEKDQLAAAKVGRRFKLKADWDGSTVGGFVLPTGRVTTTSDLHGSAGFNGELDDSGDRVESAAMKLMKDLPLPEGYDWTTLPTTVDKTRDNMKPMVFVNAFGSSTYETLAEYLGVTDINVQIDENTAAFTLGPDKIAQDVLDLLSDGATLYVTIGIQAQMNTIVSWNRTGGAVRDKKRIMTKTREKLARRFLTIGTYLGIDDAGALKTNAAQITVEDDLPLASTLLATLRPWYSVSAWDITRTLDGEIDNPEGYVTGDMITESRFKFVDGTTVIVPSVGVITSVMRSYVGQGSVSLTLRRIAVDVEAIS